MAGTESIDDNLQSSSSHDQVNDKQTSRTARTNSNGDLSLVTIDIACFTFFLMNFVSVVVLTH